jgi:hypothetical protein
MSEGSKAAPNRLSIDTALLSIFVLVMLAVSAASGFYDLFSNFRQYDDEGYWLLATRLFMDGYPLYDQIDIPYGPVSLATNWLFHDVLSIPVTNSAARYISLAYWMMLSAICAMTTFRISRSPWWAVVAYGVVFTYMQAFTNEPGHPQEIIASLAAAIPLVFWKESRSYPGLAWYCTGVLLACIVSTKINIGMFCLAGVLVVLASELRHSKWLGIVLVGSVVASIIAPFLLMYFHLEEENCLPYAIICSASLGATATALTTNREGAATGLRACIALLAGIITGILAVLFFLVINGSTIKALVSSNLQFAGTLETVYFFQEYSVPQVGLALLALLFAATISRWPASRWLAGTRRESSILVAKLAFVCLTIYAVLASGPGNGHAVLAWAGPWCWLCAIGSSPAHSSIIRKLLAAIAAWHLLLAYPIPGSQLYFGSFLVLVSAVVCLADLAGWFARRGTGEFSRRVRKVATQLAIFATILILGIMLNRSYYLRQHYATLEPLGLSGTTMMRLEPEAVELYQHLVAAMRRADVGFTNSGLNSLYFWSGVNMPAPVLVQHSLLFTTEEDRRSIIEGLKSAVDPLVIIRLPAYGGELLKIDVIDWIMSEFEVHEKYRGYLLMKRKPVVMVPEQ